MTVESTNAPRVGVVGGGVAGLVCARELERAGADVEVFEASSQVGGRVRTDDVEGYQLDVGFQILIDSYPEVRRQLDLPSLNLRSYAPGAVLARDGKLSKVAHPLKCPRLLPQTLLTALRWGLFSSIMDVLRLLKLACGWLFASPYDALDQNPSGLETTESLLRRLGLSKTIVGEFLRPFFEAIYVSPLSQQSSKFFNFVLRMLATGRACLPARGMRAVPEQLAASLRRPVALSSPVTSVDHCGLCVGGTRREFDAVVVAADWPSAAKLVKLTAPSGTRSTTWYFGFPVPAPVTEPLIVLQSHGPAESSEEELGRQDVRARVVNIGFSSVAQPTYAPPGQVLAAVTVMGAKCEKRWVLEEVERILGLDCSKWRHLRTYDIGFHQPAQLAVPEALPQQEVDGVFCCGDYHSGPTLDGAMRSGRLAAEAVVRHIGLVSSC